MAKIGLLALMLATVLVASSLIAARVTESSPVLTQADASTYGPQIRCFSYDSWMNVDVRREQATYVYNKTPICEARSTTGAYDWVNNSARDNARPVINDRDKTLTLEGDVMFQDENKHLVPAHISFTWSLVDIEEPTTYDRVTSGWWRFGKHVTEITYHTTCRQTVTIPSDPLLSYQIVDDQDAFLIFEKTSWGLR